jgi:hypothetical protein
LRVYGLLADNVCGDGSFGNDDEAGTVLGGRCDACANLGPTLGERGAIVCAKLNGCNGDLTCAHDGRPFRVRDPIRVR